MKPSGITGVTRWREGRVEAADDIVAGECAVAITFNRQPHVVMMATPSGLEELALGFSLSEGLVDRPDDILATRLIDRDDGIELALTVSPECFERVRVRRRNLSGRTGCGLCGAESLEQVMRPPPVLADTVRVSHRAVQRALGSLSEQQPLQAATGAVHCAAWCDPEGQTLAAREDVGRHNALDKLLGWRALAQEPTGPGFVVVTSRASYEMVQKCAMAGAEMMVAVSAPTSLAIAFARHCGLTLLGFARPGRHNVYTAGHRLEAETVNNA